MPIAAIVQLIVMLTPYIIKAIQESKEITEEERAAWLADLMVSNAALAKEISAYRPLPPPKKKPSR